VNRTQEVAAATLRRRHLHGGGRRFSLAGRATKPVARERLDGEDLLYEALLRRGFLAGRDEQGLWLGTGSHGRDIDVLGTIPGLGVHTGPVATGKVARISMHPGPSRSALDIALAVVALPEHHLGPGHGGFTGVGPAPFVGEDWATYCRMNWGARLPVCPGSHGDRVQPDALDIGTALLVKILPLARVATARSCDGHGAEPARVELHYRWDPIWGQEVFEALATPTPASRWTWAHDRPCLQIEPVAAKDPYGDKSVSAMLDDIQTVSRRLLDQEIIDAIGRARASTIDRFGVDVPTDEEFRNAARPNLKREFAGVGRRDMTPAGSGPGPSAAP
jgi:hypothetical protein